MDLKKAKWEYKMSDNVTDENFDKIHEAIDTTITSLEDDGSDWEDNY